MCVLEPLGDKGSQGGESSAPPLVSTGERLGRVPRRWRHTSHALTPKSLDRAKGIRLLDKRRKLRGPDSVLDARLGVLFLAFLEMSLLNTEGFSLSFFFFFK